MRPQKFTTWNLWINKPLTLTPSTMRTHVPQELRIHTLASMNIVLFRVIRIIRLVALEDIHILGMGW